MKLSESYFYTLRENVKGEESASGNLLTRAGFIKKNSSGVFMMLPLGLMTLRKIEGIIREEMVKTGALEVSMPALIPEEVYVESGRRDLIGDSMFSLHDRFKRPFVLGPTHEELFAAAANMKIKSYKDLPFSLFQFQTKFRDEPRPRFGLIRVREFVMKDAYTFDRDLEGLDQSYQKQFQAYKNSFDRMGLDYVVVKADTGIMGGLLSEEFQAITEIGEDTIVIEEQSGYASNLEVANCLLSGEKPGAELLTQEKIHTPQAKTIEEVTSFLGKEPKDFVKTLIYLADGEPLAFSLRGDHELNLVKVQKKLGIKELEMAPESVVREVTGAAVGYAGPFGLSCATYADQEVSIMENFVIGANEEDYHMVNTNLKDIEIKDYFDLRNIQEGDLCENGKGPVSFVKGIEIGNTFKLGDKYSKAMDLYYMDQNNELKPVIMGSYGIGPARCMAAIVEQNHTDHAILWPKAVAPIQVALILMKPKDEDQLAQGHKLYDELKMAGFDVLLDDRDERAGVKFNDMELIGAYMRVVLGRGLAEGKVEIKMTGQETQEVLLTDLLDFIKHEFNS